MDPLPTESAAQLRSSQSLSDISCSSGASSVTSTRDTSPSPDPTQHRLSLEDSNSDSDSDSSPTFLPIYSSSSSSSAALTTTTKTTGSPSKDLVMDPNASFSSVNDRRSKLSASHSQAGIQQTYMGRNMPSLPPSTPASSSLNGPPPRAVTSANWRATNSSSDLVLSPSSSSNSVSACASASASGNNNNNLAGGSSINTSQNVIHSPVSPSAGGGYNTSNNTNYIPVANGRLENLNFPGLTIIMDQQMEQTYGYCYDRGDGQYARLVPVDMLPPLKDIPARQNDVAGMIVLPVPRMGGPNGLPANSQQVLLSVITPPSSPSTSTDPIQVRGISTLSLYPHHQQQQYHYGVGHHHHGGSAHDGGGICYDQAGHHGASHEETQMHSSPSSQNEQQLTRTFFPPRQSRIDSIVASSPPPPPAGANMNSMGLIASPTPSNKKIKIYCDKWIHDGTCAFTQQGCKYKHEMPNDKETQEKLGLFHGYPAWWKKMQAERVRPIGELSDAPVAVSSGGLGRGRLLTHHGEGGAGGSGSGSGSGPVATYVPTWRRGDGGASLAGPSSGAGHGQQVDSAASSSGGSFAVVAGGRGGGGGFGRNRAMSQGRVFAKFTPAPSPYGPIAPPSKVDTHQQAHDMQTSMQTSMPMYKQVPSNPYNVLRTLDQNQPQDQKDDDDGEEAEEQQQQRGAKLN